MTEETNAQTLAGLAEGTTTTTETTPKETPKGPEGQAEEPAKPDSTVNETDAADKGEQSNDDDDAETEGQDDRPRKRSRSDRYKSRIAAQAARIAELEGQVGSSSKEAPKAPRLEDFNYDQQAYEDARLAFNTEQAVSKVIGETQKQERDTKIREARQELVEEFNEALPHVKERISDYDSVMDSCKVDLRKDIGDLILSSEKGPHLAYELAKNSGAKLREIQSLPPVEAARAIGRLEARLSLPTPKKQTQAPTPIKPPAGGAAPSRDPAALAQSEDASEYIAVMNAKQKRA